MVIQQGEALNRSRLDTVVCVLLTSNLRWTTASGNVLLSKQHTGLPKDSVANVSQIVSLDRSVLTELVGRTPPSQIEAVLRGIERILRR